VGVGESFGVVAFGQRFCLLRSVVIYQLRFGLVCSERVSFFFSVVVGGCSGLVFFCVGGLPRGWIPDVSLCFVVVVGGCLVVGIGRFVRRWGVPVGPSVSLVVFGGVSLIGCSECGSGGDRLGLTRLSGQYGRQFSVFGGVGAYGRLGGRRVGWEFTEWSAGGFGQSWVASGGCSRSLASLFGDFISARQPFSFRYVFPAGPSIRRVFSCTRFPPPLRAGQFLFVACCCLGWSAGCCLLSPGRLVCRLFWCCGRVLIVVSAWLLLRALFCCSVLPCRCGSWCG